MSGSAKEWAVRAAAHRDALERLRELRMTADDSAEVVVQMHLWLELQAKRCERRLAAIRPGRKVDQLARLMRTPPKAVGRPRGDGARDEAIHARVARWLDEQLRRGRRATKAAAFAAVAKQLTNHRKGEAPTPDAIKAAFHRHERRSETRSK